MRGLVFQAAYNGRPDEMRSLNVNYSPVFDEEGNVRGKRCCA